MNISKNNLFTLIMLLTATSCSFLNDRTVDIAMSSNPPGADIYIGGKHYGRTPAIIKIEPAEPTYTANFVKEGYGSTTITMETWTSLRHSSGDTARCLADSLGVMFVIPAASFFSIHCRDFKKDSYFANIPNLTGATNKVNNSYNPYDTAPEYYNAPNVGQQSSFPVQGNSKNGDYDPYSNPSSYMNGGQSSPSMQYKGY